MTTCVLIVALLSTTAALITSGIAQSNDCPVEINGSRKGEPGNIQDNMFHSLTIDPRNENIVFAGTEANGIFKTTDGGVHWVRLRRGLKCTALHNTYSQIFGITVDPTNSQTVYASTVNGPGPPSPPSYPSASGGIYKSTDGGITWSQRTNGLTNTYACYVLVDSLNPNRIYAGIGGLRSTFPQTNGQFFLGGVWVSMNVDSGWLPVTLPPGVNTNVPVDMLLRGANQQILYASWQIHRTDSTTAYGLTKSTDRGETWMNINPPGTLLVSFDVSLQDPNFIVANDTTAQRRIHRSTDGGNTWAPISTAGFFGEMKIHPTNNQTIFYTTFMSIMRSTDGLATAQVRYTDSSLLSGQQIQDVKISQSNPNVVWACAKGYYLYRSTDGGDTFIKITAIRDSVYGVVNGIQEPKSESVPVVFSLDEIYPNPFNPSATIKFGIANAGFTTLTIYNVLGEIVTTLVDEELNAGKHERTFVSSGLASGMYMCQLRNAGQSQVRKLMLLK